jgi:rare lipoprotein A
LRPGFRLRTTRSVHVAIATIMLAVPASAFALSGAASNNDSANTGAAAPAFELRARISPRLMHLGQPVAATGAAPASEAGHWAVLQTAAKRHARWRSVAAARFKSNGRFSLHARLPHSGFVRVVDAGTRSASATTTSWSMTPGGAVASAPESVKVTAKFSVAHPSLDVLGGQRLAVRGRLMPWRSGREVRLVGHSGRRGWRTLARTRTRAAGRFTLRFAADSGVDRRLRVVFDGDRANRGLSASAGALTVYSDESVASWYNDAGGTACGFHAGLGVANKSLPCGTKVRFRYGGRSVTATVDDRGPFIPGRTWDFNQNLAGALGFGGVGTVWATR